ncbi:ribosomal RNA processing protein 36 homolog [Oratosquilla oratoria]|uniref:ribosomal RNA processing protein 36 homolog n=1 Tax=Oratosquilla oratoria TaxID=337810 RepID=UPI003F772FE2
MMDKEINYDDSSESEEERESESEEESASEKERDYSKMSMEQLLQLQEEIGTKAFKKKVLDSSGTSSSTEKSEKRKLKRANKNRPREVPMIRRAAPLMKGLEPGKYTQRKIKRDPRFDDLSGNLQLKIWKNNYSFLRDTRQKEKEVLKKELKEEGDPDRIKKLKETIQRMDNQEREQAAKDKQEALRRQEREKQIEALRQGNKPYFVSASERKMKMKAEQYENLKKTNKLDKYMEKQERKIRKKERKQQGLL